jgi:short subunit dehydrogenase-like uncharacterized protein
MAAIQRDKTITPMQDWMIYGVNGYTGELIAREAATRGLRPILAGRREPAVATLAAELGLPHRAFPAEAADLANVKLILNCAGPFSATAAPLMAACIMAQAHYLDITGEIDVFEHAHTLSEVARAAEVVICPGVGFDVIPTDCVARALSEALPDATQLALGFETSAGLSPGTAKTAVEGLPGGCKIRREGKIVTIPMGSRTRQIDFGRGSRTAMAFPWGDVSTAYYTTGIPNIEVFMAVRPGVIWGAWAGNLVAPLLSLGLVQAALKQGAGIVTGPSAEARAASPCYVWGEARSQAGAVRTARIRTANGYDVTIHGSLAVVQTLLARNDGEAGHLTPVRLCGVDLITGLPGSGPLTLW